MNRRLSRSVLTWLGAWAWALPQGVAEPLVQAPKGHQHPPASGKTAPGCWEVAARGEPITLPVGLKVTEGSPVGQVCREAVHTCADAAAPWLQDTLMEGLLFVVLGNT